MGGGGLSLEKGTDCGPTAAELWLSRQKLLKRGSCPVIMNVHRELLNLFI